MNQTTKETRRRSYDAVLPKRAARCRLILEALGNRELTASEITEDDLKVAEKDLQKLTDDMRVQLSGVELGSSRCRQPQFLDVIIGSVWNVGCAKQEIRRDAQHPGDLQQRIMRNPAVLVSDISVQRCFGNLRPLRQNRLRHLLFPQ